MGYTYADDPDSDGTAAQQRDAVRLAYLAGIIDGEGCLYIRQKYTKWKTYDLFLTITNTNEDLIAWLKLNFGGQAKRTIRHPHRAIWQWYVTNIRAEKLLGLVRPHLVVKASQANLAMEFRKTVNTHNNQPISEEVRAQREMFRLRLQGLNSGVAA